MKHKVIVEIDGIRHRMFRGRNNVDPCSKCSLEKHCTKIVGSPCLSPYDCFKKEEEQDTPKTIKQLADAMYYAAQHLTTDASRLHKAMEDYHQFIIQNNL